MATSGSIVGSVKRKNGTDNSNYVFTAEWKRNSYSIDSNTSNITITLQIKYTYSSNGAYNLDKKPDVSLSVNGESKTPTVYNIDTRKYQLCTFATWTGNVTHNDDGSLSCPISASFTHYGSETLQTGSVSGSASIDTIPRASTIISFDSVDGNFDLDGSFKVKYTSHSNTFTNKLRISIPNVIALETIDYNTSGTSFNLKPESLNYLYSYTKDINEVKLGVVIETYNGSTKIGESKEIIHTCYVPDSLQPNVGTITVEIIPVETSTGQKNILVKNKNKIRVTISGSTSSTGAGLRGYAFGVLLDNSFIELKATQASPTIDIGPFSQTGDLYVIASVVDTRERSDTGDGIHICCYDYEQPSLSGFNAYRANSDGIPDVNGTYLKCIYSQKYSDVNSTNSATVTVHYNEKTSNSDLIYLGETDKTYNVYLSIEDTYGGKDKTSVITVFGQSRIINISKDGTGIAIGKMAEIPDGYPGIFESRWPAKFNDDCKIEGGLTVGKSSQHETPTDGITIHDVRYVDIKPDSFGDRNANFYFDEVDSKWMSILHMTGWDPNTNAAWELAGNSHSASNDNTLKYRQGIGKTWGNWQTVITDKNISSYVGGLSYLPLSGGTLTGKLTLPTDFHYTNSNYGLNCVNSDIVNINSLYFSDVCDAAGEGIHFGRGGGVWDTLYAVNGELMFHPNRSTGSEQGGHKVYNSSHFRCGLCTLSSSAYTTVTFSSPFDREPTVMLTPFTDDTGVLAAKVRSASKNGFEAGLGGTVTSGTYPGHVDGSTSTVTSKNVLFKYFAIV